MTPHIYRFGVYRIDLSARELHCGGELATLSPKVFDCLVYLIEHRDRAVGRDELIAAVWGKVDVSDNLLGQTVLKARRTIGDTGNEQHAIRTIPRFGYRWIAQLQVEDASAPPATFAPVAVVPAEPLDPASETVAAPLAIPLRDAPEAPAPTAATPVPRTPQHRTTVVALLVLAASIAAIGWWRIDTHRDVANTVATPPHAPAPAGSTNDATAVLPVDVSSQGDGSWLRLGLMDLVATRLRSAGLPVVPSDNVVALTRGGNGSTDAVAKAVTEGTGARFVVIPAASKAAADWTVHLTLRSADGSQREVEAHDPDAIKAGRQATDRLLGLLGKHVPAALDEKGDLSASELLSRVEAAFLTDDLPAARRLLDSAPPGMQQSPELRLRVAQIDYRAGQLDAARKRLDALLVEVSSESNPVLRARILNGLGVVNVSTDRYADAEREFAESITLLENRNQPAALGQAYTGHAVSNAAQGRYEPALADFSRARVALELAGDSLSLARVEANEGIVAAKRGHYSEALAMQQRAAQRFERFGALNELAVTLANIAGNQLILLQPADALATADRAWSLIGRLENQAALTSDDYQRERATAWLILVRALRAQGKDAAASDQTDRLLAWAKTMSTPPADTYAPLADAERLWAGRRLDSAYVAYAKALEAAEQDGIPADTAEVVVSYGTSLIADGELDRASAVVGQVARWADRDFACALLQVRYYRAIGERDAWQAALKRARSLAGERQIPTLLTEPPGTTSASVHLTH